MKRSGLTLIELVVSVTIMAILVLVVVNIFIGVNTFTKSEQGKIVAGDNATRTFSILDETLRQSKSIVGSATVNGTPYTSGASSVIILLPSIVGGTLSSAVTDTGVITFDQNSGIISLIISADPTSSRPSGTSILTTGVSDVYFRYPTDDPAAATAITAAIITSATTNGKTTYQPAVLYVPFRNHS